VSAQNAAGVSGPTNTVTLTFPEGCFGVLQPPSNIQAFRTGNTITALWDAPALGPAPTGYVLDVGGAFVGRIPTAGKALSGVVASGTCALSLRSTNVCGSGIASPVQTIVAP
jgi:hypothetical protein